MHEASCSVRLCLIILVSLALGCDSGAGSASSSAGGSASSPPTSPGLPPVPHRQPDPEPPTLDDADQEASRDEYADDEANADTKRVVAEAGVGKRGRNYGGGVISEPIRQYFRQGQRIQFLNMQHAMNLYKAEHGKLPTSHEQFMEQIIQPNGIELPDLPPGERYVYDPQAGELMVERPR